MSSQLRCDTACAVNLRGCPTVDTERPWEISSVPNDPSGPAFHSSHSEVLAARLCLTLCDPWTVAHQAPLSIRNSPGKSTGVGGHSHFHPCPQFLSPKATSKNMFA